MSRYIHPLLGICIFLILIAITSFGTSINLIHSSHLLFLWSLFGLVFAFSLVLPLSFSIQKKVLSLFSAGCAVLFIGHSLFPLFFSFLPNGATQFILRVAGEHNNLGDLAGLALVGLTSSPTSPLLLSIGTLFFFGIMVVSFSKSAFLSFLIVFALYSLQKRGTYIYWFFISLLCSLFVVAVYTSEFSPFPPVQIGQKIMQQTLHLKPKPLLSVRDSYYPQVFRAWGAAPLEQKLFGYGSGNYIYPSVKTGISTDLTPPETHNILLGIFIENGMLAAFWFIIFCFLIVYRGLRNRNPSVYLFLYLLMNFQTHYSYIIPFFMMLFFFFAGQSLHEKISMPERNMSFFVILFVAILITFASWYTSITLQNNKNALAAHLSRAIKRKDTKEATKILGSLEALTPYEEAELVTWSSQYTFIGDLPNAVRLLDKLSVYSPRWYLLYLPQQMKLMEKEKSDIKKYFGEKKMSFSTFPFSEKEKRQLNDICQKYAKMKCIE